MPPAAGCWLHSPEGTGTGLWVRTGQPVTAQVLALVDQVQEWAVQALWQPGRGASWRACPYHPDRHPLAARERDEQAVRLCLVLDARVSAVGSLTGFRSRERHHRRRA